VLLQSNKMIHVNTQGSHYPLSNILTFANTKLTKVVVDFGP